MKLKKNEFCDLNITVPQLLAAPGSSAEAAKVASAFNSHWQQVLASDVAEYNKTLTGKDACKEAINSYQVGSSFTLATDLDSTIASVLVQDWGYYGGAHGDNALSAYVFNTKTGAVYTNLGVFMDDSKLSAFLDKVGEGLKANDENFDPSFGWLDARKAIKSMKDIKNFYVDANGITIYYNPYEVGSYAEGQLKATIYWYDVAELGLKKSGPALDLPQMGQ